MSLLKKRSQIADSVIKDKFIRQQLAEESKEIDKAQESLMVSRSFDNPLWYSGRKFNINGNTLDYTHLGRHRLVDMRTRNTRNGKIRKKSHPNHNRILYGHANDIVKRLHFGFTEAAKKELSGDL